jgi:hypothetical protein
MRRKILVSPFFLFLLGSLHAQNVGIGTASPVEKLHVAGNIKADTAKPNVLKITPNAGAGKILTSDANGNASWQTKTAAEGNIGFGVWGDCATNGNISEYNPVVDATPNGPGINFGWSVSVSGNYAIVSAPGDETSLNNDRGSVSIFQFNGSNWVLMQKIMNTSGVLGDHFGSSVSIDRDVAVVGVSYNDIGGNVDQGSANVYQYNGSSWVLVQQLTDPTGAGSDNFGHSVSISENYIVIGSPSDDVGANSNQGSCCIFQYNGSNWAFMQKLTGAGGATNDAYGWSVAVSANSIVVGSFLDDNGANTNQGSAFVYQFLTGSWSFIQKITAPGGSVDQNFGYSVAISGTDIIVGAIGDEQGGSDDVGAAFIFKLTPFTIVNFVQRLSNPNPSNYDWFGRGVAISGNYAMVGVEGDLYLLPNSSLLGRGAAIVYQRMGTWWGKLQTIHDPLAVDNDRTGYSVALDATTKRFLIGNPASFSGNRALFGKIN